MKTCPRAFRTSGSPSNRTSGSPSNRTTTSKHTAKTTQEWLQDKSLHVLEWARAPIQPDRALEDPQRGLWETP
jgi:hypothetical protein